METIKQVLIENFQSHARSKIEFGSGLNVIVGPSDHGKSSIIRALRWALFNEPRGADFIRTGESECRVTVELSSGTTITRSRSSSKNRYILNAPNGAEQVFEGFGTTVPKEIVDAHGMFQICLDSDMVEPLNFGYQLDGPFLLAESGATKAKAIGRLSGVHIVDSAIRRLLRDLTGLQQEERHLAAAAAGLQERLPEFDGLPHLAAAVARGEVLAALLREKIDRCRKITDLSAKWSDLTKEHERIIPVLHTLAAIPDAERAAAKARDAITLYGQLTAAAKKLSACEDENAELVAILTKTGKLKEAEAIFFQLQAKQMSFDRLRRAADTLAVNTSNTLAARNILARTALAERAESECYNRGRRLLASMSQFSDIHKRISQAEEELALQHMARQALSQLPRAESCWAKADSNTSLRNRMIELLTAWRENDKNQTAGYAYLKKLSVQTDRILREYQTLLRDIGKCPFCYNDIDEPAVQRIVEIMTKEGKPVNAE